MNRRHALLIGLALTVGARVAGAQPTTDRHHYRVTARVRPLAVFWISRSNVGDALITRRLTADEAQYSLLIGSDPDRAPLHINRWGYLEEEIRGAESRLLGVMTESDEETVQQAEANVRRQAGGRHPFKVIQASADAGESRSRVRSIFTSQDYTVREHPIVLDLARQEATGGRTRVMRVPAEAHNGFLCAVADAMRDPLSKPVTYVYFGRLYELRRTRTARIANAQIGPRSYGGAIAADFLSTSLHDGEQTRFSITYAAGGPLAGVPLRVTYQPRWWMQIELTIDDPSTGGAPTAAVTP